PSLIAFNAASEREGRQVDVAAGEDYAEFGGGSVGAGRKVEAGDSAGLQKWSDSYGGGGLDDNFQALPDGAHRGNDFSFADEQDAVKMLTQKGEGARRERGAQAVGDRVARFKVLQRAGGEGAVGVVGTLGVAA